MMDLNPIMESGLFCLFNTHDVIMMILSSLFTPSILLSVHHIMPAVN